MNDLDLNDVRAFVAVAQAGTLTAAAKELHWPCFYSQPIIDSA